MGSYEDAMLLNDMCTILRQFTYQAVVDVSRFSCPHSFWAMICLAIYVMSFPYIFWSKFVTLLCHDKSVCTGLSNILRYENI
jgi:hypothetical protein